MEDLESILRDPSAEFAEPREVLTNQQLTLDEKIRVLRQWRYDLIRLNVASAESLTGDSNPAADIQTIDECLRQLRADPTKP